MDQLLTFVTNWTLDSVLDDVDLSGHIPIWGQDQQRAFVIYALCGFPMNGVVFRERPKGSSSRYTVVDGRERLFALQQFFEGGLIIDEAHFKGPILGQCLDCFTERQWEQEGYEEMGLKHGGLYPKHSKGGLLVQWRVTILRDGSEDHDSLIRGALNVRSEPASPELILRACCTYLESVVSGASRKSFLPLPTTENSVASYQFNPSPGVYGASISLFVREGAVFFNETSRPIEGLLDFKTKLRCYYPGAQFD